MKSYLYKTAIFLVSGLLGVALLNLIVDPLDIYRLVRRPGLNEIKPRLSDYSRLAKPLWLRARPYERLALGSSRTEIGIPISASGWGPYTGPGMNAAVSGARLIEVAEIFQHALRSAPIKTVVIGVDFFMFNAHALGAYTSPQVLAQYNSEPELLLNQAASTLLSFNITGSSLYTLTRQRPKHDKYRISGQMNSDREAAKSQQAGYPQRFQRFADSFMESIWSPCRSNAFTYRHGRRDSMAIFADLLASAARHNIDVKLFVPPVHARMLEALSAAGHWQQYEQWKRDMATVIAEIKQKKPQAAIELWDFSGYNAYTMEEFPGQGGRMQWYIDSTHFSEALGRRLVEEMYGDGDHGLGRRLSPATTAAVIEQIRREQQAYRQRHPEVLQEMRKRFQQINRGKQKTGKAC
jgi:hypothetical protein